MVDADEALLQLSGFWGRTMSEAYSKRLGTFKPEEPVSVKVSAVGLMRKEIILSKLNA